MVQNVTIIWDVNVNNLVISKLVDTNNNSTYLIEYLGEVTTPLVLTLSKVSEYIKTFKDKGGEKNKNNKLLFLSTDNDKLLEKYKNIWTKIEDLINIEVDVLPVYDNKYVKTNIRTYGNKVHNNFQGLNIPEDGVECKFFTVISIDLLLVYDNKYYLQVYLDICDYKIVNNQIIDYLDDSLFFIFINKS